jgi:hypothetical protein
VTTDLRAALTAAYADVSLADPLEQVVRRGRRIRRAHRARRVAPALVAAAAVVVGVGVGRGGDEPFVPGPVELVGQQSQTFPLSLDSLPAGLTGPSFSLDPSFEEVAPGRAHAGWHDPADPASGIGLQVDPEEPSTDGTEEIGEARIGPAEATVHRTEVTGGGPVVTVVWERSDDQWVTVSGEGRFATETSVVSLAEQVVDRPVVVPLQLALAPRGWVLVAYKDDRIVTLADPAGDPATDATARTLTASLPQQPSDPADLSREVGATGDLVPVTVHGRPASLLPTHDGWFLQAELPDGTVFVVQAPGDFTARQVVEVAEGVSRR